MKVPDRRNGLYYINFEGKEYILPSVTAVTSETMPKPGLMYWAAKTAARAALHDPTLGENEAARIVSQAKSEGADRGSVVHDFIEAVDNGATPNFDGLPENVKPYVNAFMSFRKDLEPKLVLNECRIVNFTLGYAGRLDRVYEIKGVNVLADFKTSKDYYPEMGLQLAAYKHAEFTFKQAGSSPTPMVKVDKTMIVLLDQKGNYTLKMVDEPIEVFLHLKKVWEWMNEDKLSVVRKP